MPGQHDGLHHRGQIVEAVHEYRQPGRIEAIAEIAEQQPDRKHLAEEEPVILQMQRRPHQRRQQDGAGDPEKRFRPAAIEKAAREQFLRDRRCDAERDHQQPQRAIGARRLQHLPHKSGRDLASRRARQQVPSHHQNAERDGADQKIDPGGPAQREIIGKRRARQADREPQRGEHGRQPRDHRERNRQAAADDMDRGGHDRSALPAAARTRPPPPSARQTSRRR